MKPFAPSRDDGRSDRQIVFELVKDAEPDTVFPYIRIAEVLQDGLETPVSRSRIYQAAKAANSLMLQERRRYLCVVRRIGYRVIRAAEHLPVAIDKKRSAATKIKVAIEVLNGVQWDELPSEIRKLHEAQLLVLSAHHQMFSASRRRHEEQEHALENLRQRIERLEGLEGQEDEAA